ncbi:hypothetical protein AXG93_2601s1090 [Marchantia polymorpha subsp. ruderalis]|uniref:Uncharacterized protein n=1 Tax=Marchantia polymorpha subsp. ruderalis TaxID=1480154 RepID=A0A176VV50_MARPO|nr:hypothetical protein AXG93_2601s1090 [Marchantia polymorpha subsp. ruderalis]
MEPDRASHSRRLPPDTPTIESFNLPDNSTLKVALQPGYSIRFDDLPSRFQIRIMDRRSVSPGGTRQEPTRQRSPGGTSQEPTRQRWMEDYGPPRWEDEGNRVPNLPPSEIQLPPSPSRSREQMQEELRRDMYENSDPVGFRETTCETCNTVGVDGEKIYLRKPSIQYLSMTDGRKSSQQPSASPSLSRQPSSFIDSQRPSRDFRRNNIHSPPDLHHLAVAAGTDKRPVQSERAIAAGKTQGMKVQTGVVQIPNMKTCAAPSTVSSLALPKLVYAAGVSDLSALHLLDREGRKKWEPAPISLKTLVSAEEHRSDALREIPICLRLQDAHHRPHAIARVKT